ncbi:hypothetical protein BH20VER2_BH20VER2_18690 [soil metagenome]
MTAVLVRNADAIKCRALRTVVSGARTIPPVGAAFDYDVVSSGAGVGVQVRF